MDPARLHAVMNGSDRSLRARGLRCAAACAEPFYRAVTAARNSMFDRGIRVPRFLSRPVISVGNLTTGGTGKTPMVTELARKLNALGAKPAVLLRGYQPWSASFESGRAREPSDYPQLTRALSDFDKTVAQHGSGDEYREYVAAFAELTDVEVHADSNRFKAGELVLERKPEVDCFLLDDAFQHRQLHRDLDLVLIDASSPFGFDRVLPRGMLRESAANLRRADAVIVTRADAVGDDDLAALCERIAALSGKPPVAVTRFTWGYLLDHDDQRLHLGHLEGVRVLGVCGVGNPTAFGRMLRDHADPASDVHAFADHFHYTAESLADLMRRAEDERFDAVVTTEKDWVKWKLLLDQFDRALPVYRPVLGVEFLEGAETLDALLRACLQPDNTPPAPQ